MYGYSDYYTANAVRLFNAGKRGIQILKWRLGESSDWQTQQLRSGEVAEFCRKRGLALERNEYDQGWLVVAETEKEQFSFKLWYNAQPPLRAEWDAHTAAYEIGLQEKRVQSMRQSVIWSEQQVERAQRSLAEEQAKLDELRKAA